MSIFNSTTPKTYLTDKGLTTLKIQTKQFAKALSAVSNSKPFKLTPLYNTIAVALGHTSHSALTMYSQQMPQSNGRHQDFDFCRDISINTVNDMFGHSFTQYIAEAIALYKSYNSPAPALPCISYIEFKHAYDDGEVNGGKLNATTGMPYAAKGLPSTAKLVPASNPALTSLSMGDMFTVAFLTPTGDIQISYTVMEKSRMMDTGTPVLIVNQGTWCDVGNGGFRVS